MIGIDMSSPMALRFQRTKLEEGSGKPLGLLIRGRAGHNQDSTTFDWAYRSGKGGNTIARVSDMWVGGHRY